MKQQRLHRPSYINFISFFADNFILINKNTCKHIKSGKEHGIHMAVEYYIEELKSKEKDKLLVKQI